ncbi:YceI family protein [Lysinibacillus sp. MHQ-1]|nr:YceI family protein [Lysinibacillus sp. MHQ-1]
MKKNTLLMSVIPHLAFSVRHMMISKIHGTFESYNAEIAAVNIEKMQDASISITIAVASVSTKKS